MNYFILIKLEEPALQQKVEQILQNVFRDRIVLFADTEIPVLNEQTSELFIITDKLDSSLQSLLNLPQARINTILYTSQPLAEYIEHFEKFCIQHLIIQNKNDASFDQLWITLEKIMSGDIAGAEKYLSAGMTMLERSLHYSEDRYELIETVLEFMQPHIKSPRFQGAARSVLEELLMNAFYSAPVDDLGNRPFAKQGRTRAVELPTDKPILVKYGFDGKHLVISVKDLYGSFDDYTVIIDCLFQHFKGNLQIKAGAGGAGLGLVKLFNASTRLVFNLDQGHFTEIISFIDLSIRFSKFQRNPSSLGIFTK